MSTRAAFPRVFLAAMIVAALLSLAGTASSPAWGAPAASDTPPEVQRALEGVLAAKVAALLSEKDADGQPYRRGSYSKLFHRMDDNKYQAGFHVDTASKKDLVTERYLVTLERGASGSWSITSEELQDTYKGLHRGVLDDETCSRFDTFSFAREGLTVKASSGSVCRDFLLDDVVRFTIGSPDLSYEYMPPVEDDRPLYEVYRKDNEKDVVFTPEFAHFECDPATCTQILSTAFAGLIDTAYSEIHPPLMKQLDVWKKEARDALRENPFRGFRRLHEPDHKQFSVYIENAGIGDHAIWLNYDSHEGREVTFSVRGLGGTVLGSDFSTPLFAYYSAETRAGGASPQDLERRPDSDGRDYDLESLVGTVELGFGDGETLTGDITYGLTAKRALREIPFAIARLDRDTEEKRQIKNPTMTINALQDAAGNDLTWVRTGLFSGLVVLPREAPAGSKLTMRLQFENRDSIYKVTPTYSYVDRGGWLPFVRFGDFIHEFDLTVKVPSRYKTLGIGTKVSDEKTKDGASITRWVAKSPVSFPTVIFGTYYEADATQVAKKLDGTKIPVTIHVDKDSMADWEITPKSLTKFADDAANSINLFSNIYGIDYPYSKLDLVNDPAPAFYGQAPSSIVYLGSPTFKGKGLLASFSGQRTGDDLPKFTDSLVAHEVAHQWWGSLVANSNFRHYWFIESLAEYSAALFIEAANGKDAYQVHVADWRKEILENDMRGRVQDSYTVWQGPGGFGPFRAAIYAKGPYAFHIMRSTWGDEAFFKFLKTLAAELAGKEIVTRDIQQVAEQSFGANLDWFFDQWLRGVGLPEFTFTYSVRTAEDGSQLVEGTIDQRILLKPAMAIKEELAGEYFTGIIPITIVGKSGKEYRKRLIIEKPSTAFKFNLPEKPKDIIFNKYGESLSYDVIVKASS